MASLGENRAELVKKKFGSMWTYYMANSLMIDWEIIIELATMSCMTYIVKIYLCEARTLDE